MLLVLIIEQRSYVRPEKDDGFQKRNDTCNRSFRLNHRYVSNKILLAPLIATLESYTRKYIILDEAIIEFVY